MLLHHRPRARAAAACLSATLVLAGCGTQEPDPDASGSERSGTEESAEPEEPVSDDVPGAGSPTAQQAVADLAGQLDVPESEVAVVAVEEVTWRDGSLGCSEPGMMYTQALVPGSRLTLEAQGERYEYHAGGSRAPFLCEKPTQ